MFYKVGPTLLYLYLDHGLSVVKLGEEARVLLPDFPWKVGSDAICAGCGAKSWKTDIHAKWWHPESAPLLPELRAVSGAWLGEKKTVRRAFLSAFFKMTMYGNIR